MRSVLDTIVTPPEWDLVPFGRLVERSREAGRPDLPPLSVFLDAGVVPRATRKDNHNRLGSDMGKYLVVRPGDVVFNKLRTWQGGLGVSRYNGIVSPAYFICRPLAQVDSRFLHYLLRSTPYLAELTRVSKFMPPSQFDVLWDDLRLLPILIPERRGQAAIADYLDIETGRLDALISKKRRMIELLNGRRQAVISAAVLGKRGPLRVHRSQDSGLARRDHIVMGCPLKYLLDLNDSGVWGNDPTGEHDTVVLRSTNISLDGSWRIHDPAVRHISGVDKVRKRLSYGDIVVVKSSGSPEHLGKSAIVTEEVATMGPCFANFVQRLRPSPSADSRYIWYVLNSKWAADEMTSLGNTTTGLRNLNGTIIGSIRIPVTRFSEQRATADYLDIETGRIDALNSKKRRTIELLTERRQALITAAVTGELAVPGVAA